MFWKMFRNRPFLGLSLVSALACCAVAQSTAPAGDPDTPIVLPAGGKVHFIAYGDIRFTDPTKPRPSDPVRRVLLVNKIAREKPAFLIVSGDLVLDGNNAADWQRWDLETQPWKQAGIAVFPVLGNHDLHGGETALANYFRHFPALEQRRWYKMRAGSALFFMLDSNTEPSSPEWSWLAGELQRIPADVQFVFVIEHHPLMTQSHDDMPAGEDIGRGGHTLRAQEAALAATLEQARARVDKPFIVIAGHVHNYEHYTRNGVTYITSGGGGATPYRIERRPGDPYRDPGASYHYCDITLDGNHLKFKMVKLGLEGEKSKWTVRDSFQLTASKQAEAAAR